MKEYPHWEVGLRTITDLVPLFILIFVSCFLVWFHEEMRSDTGIHSPRNCTPLWKESSTYLPIWLGSVTGCRGGHLYLGYRSNRSGLCVELRGFPTLFFLLMFYGFGKGVEGKYQHLLLLLHLAPRGLRSAVNAGLGLKSSRICCCPR